MKIKIFHTVCCREVLVRQILDSGGHCPWDGKAFNSDYTAVLAEALAAAEEAGGVLENALEKIAGMEPEMTIDRDSVIAPLAEHIEALDRHQEGAAAVSRPGWRGESRGRGRT